MSAGKIYGKEFAKIYSDHWANWGEEMWPFLLKLVKKNLPDARTWLDLCCGTGQLLKHVTGNGYAAVGVDSSPHQIDQARKRASKAQFLVGDITRLDIGKTFDVITCTNDSLNYLTKKRDLGTAFHRITDHLDPEGLFIFDMNTFWGLEDRWDQTFTIEDSECFVTVEAVFDRAKGLGSCRITGFTRVENRRRLYRRFEEIHVERGYVPGEIEDLIDHSGLIVVRDFDGEDFGRPKRKSGRLIYMCQIRA